MLNKNESATVPQIHKFRELSTPPVSIAVEGLVRLTIKKHCSDWILLFTDKSVREKYCSGWKKKRIKPGLGSAEQGHYPFVFTVALARACMKNEDVFTLQKSFKIMHRLFLYWILYIYNHLNILIKLQNFELGYEVRHANRYFKTTCRVQRT